MFCRSRLVRDAVGIVVFDEGVASSVVSESFGCVEEEHVSHVVVIHGECPGLILPSHGAIEVFDIQKNRSYCQSLSTSRRSALRRSQQIPKRSSGLLTHNK